MLDMIFGVAIGTVICLFALWCYIKGERNGFKIAKGEQPEQIKSPVQAITEVVQDTKKSVDNKGLTYDQQVKNMMAFDPILPTDKKD